MKVKFYGYRGGKYKLEKEIYVINKIIKEAIIHGADSGGSYESNKDNLVNAINEWLNMKNLSCEYIIDKIATDDRWEVYQIIHK